MIMTGAGMIVVGMRGAARVSSAAKAARRRCAVCPGALPSLAGSRHDESCARQEWHLSTFATRAGYKVVGPFRKTGSSADPP